jgi:S-adenosylmethionine:tRNA ribosyltransferase-isomerase
MRASDFRFDLPPDRIAQYPPASRRDSRLLVVDAGGGLADRGFEALGDLLNAGDLLVMNDTRVMKARLAARKSTGGRAEILVERILDARRMLAHLRASKSPAVGSTLIIADAFGARVSGRSEDLFELELDDGATVDALLEAAGSIPLPPYIRREPEPVDEERYVEMAFVTLQVGAGTFQPLRGDDVDAHVMHAESVRVSAEVCEQIAETRARGGRVIAVGTTTVRALESAAAGTALEPFQGETRLFIKPGYRFRVVDALLTNFHLPESTLLMLVCAFAGFETVMDAYRHAVREGYRFFSYGDAMFLTAAAP